jgi:flavin reductase (DIM6/NTAB) family NADH-FMN oxidoreductase RutF
MPAGVWYNEVIDVQAMRPVSGRRGEDWFMPVSPELFRRALGRFASGVTVVTADDGQKRAGLTVSAFCSVSLTPPYVLVCIDHRSQALPVIRNAGRFAVNLLAEGQADISAHFASKIGDKFAAVAWSKGPGGQPLLDDTLGWLECTVIQEVSAGDHFILIGQVEAADIDDSKKPLLYYHSQYQRAVPLQLPNP